MRLTSSSAATWTLARPEPTMPATISSTWLRSRRSTPACFSSTASAVRARSPLGAVGQKPALLVDDRDVLGLETFDGRCDQMADRPDLAGLELATELQDDGGARSLAVAIEQPALRNDEMHAGGRTLPIERIVRDSSPSSARRWLMFWTKLVDEKASPLSKIS